RRPLADTTDNLSVSKTTAAHSPERPVFLQNISTSPDVPAAKKAEMPVYRTSDSRPIPHPVGNEDYSELRYKYAILTNTPVEDLNNLRLLIFMEQWYGVPYHYGGTGREGIDCSAF